MNERQDLKRCGWTRVAGVAAVLAALGGCSSDDSSACSSDDCAAATPDAGQRGDGAADAATCTPKPGPDVPDDGFADTNCDGIDGDVAHAVFVSPLGSDSATGTIDAPVVTLAKAIALATTAGKDVYACDATYPEAVQVGPPGVSIYGGYDCAHGWARGDHTFTLAPPAGVPLTLSSVPRAMTVDHATLRAADGTEAGASSIAAIATASPSVTFHRVVFQAGAGAPGSAGAPVMPALLPAASGFDLYPTTGDVVEALDCFRENDCSTLAPGLPDGSPAPAGQSAGGGGGDGSDLSSKTPPRPPTAGQPAGYGGGTRSTAGADGLPGPTGSAGASAESGLGTFTASGYAATNAGADGMAGGPGGGGGGGAGGNWFPLPTCACPITVGGGGGAGGNGGAGGAGGYGGGGGGASIALLSFDSGVTLTSCELGTSGGGEGGAPSAGAAGQRGGAGSPGNWGAVGSVTDDCICNTNSANMVGALGWVGGDGGKGGAGGSGGAGGGGPSIGVASVGPAPVVTASTYHLGLGGIGASASSVPKAADGIQMEILIAGAGDASVDAATGD